ncbi:hypothetical protein [Chondromyces crocatus]|uniref:Uncharacterized protein n=1 Tax=Chondromyces crocatus TaxID=52 RepID=A0A0K1ET53_CHOCO|nr:hypothetical protein [Chondromyces crocatus]AKT43808.1 uncharacterized protein CMC5_080450 [Chondromyces crocatus]
MFRSPSRDRVFRGVALGALALVAGAIACSSVAEWEEVPGTLELYADPLPPTPGQPLTIGVLAKNVGPVDILQGSERVATFANVELEERRSFQIVAVSAELPVATAVAYDYQKLVVQAAPFTGDLPDAGPPPDSGPSFEGENCPGVVDLMAHQCSADGGAPLTVRLYNARSTPVSVYKRPVDIGNPSQCTLDLAALTSPGAISQFEVMAGTVLRVIDDVSVQVVREVALPDTVLCSLEIAP